MEADALKFIFSAGPNNSGGRAIKKPKYFEDMFDVVKDTAKACPKKIQDSLTDNGQTQDPGQAQTSQIKEKQGTNVAASDEDGPIVEEEEKMQSGNSPFF